MPIRVLVADDQPVVRTGFQTILQAQPDMVVVGEAADGDEAVQQARRLRPDVVLMDVRMPRMDGLQATRQIAGPDVPDPIRVLILTTFDLDEYVYEALRAGASGFLLKDVRREELVAAVRIIAAGEALLAPTVTRRLIGEFARRPAEVGSSRAVEALTPRERDVFELVARGLTNAEIAARLFLGEATVKSHVAHLLVKLDLRDRIQAVIYAYENGLIRPGDPPL
jgi:DNA-binding NarL/FixJ family response regulator